MTNIILKRLGATLVALTVGSAGCSLQEQTPPPLTGPSEFGTSVTLSATPDQLPRDGASQSVVTVTALDSSSRPKTGLRLSIGVSSGSVSDSQVVTGSDGRAAFTFTAPAASELGNAAVIQVVPVGDNADNAIPRSVTILLTGVANATAPTASFTVSPVSPQVQQVTTFDASASTDEGDRCGSACTYSWNFGDGTTRTGRIVTHSFSVARIHTVTLTVTDAAGLTAEARQTVTVAAVNSPTVSISVTPASPAVDQQATFTATAVAAAGHSIQSWVWNFGDGTTVTTGAPTVAHGFAVAGSYGVSVTVTDDLGQTGRASVSVIVTSGITFPTPAFTYSPTDPLAGQVLSFNASGITAANGATIVTYSWDFGDGSSIQESAQPTITHAFATPQTFVVRLTVTDSAGRTATIAREVAVD